MAEGQLPRSLAILTQMESPNGNGGSSWSKLGTTLPVGNVQSLAAGEMTAETMERYIHPDIDKHAVVAEHSDDVPVIDLGKLLNGETMEAEITKLRFACEEWGFFQLVNHGVPDEVIAGVRRDTEKFFQLPLDVKNSYAQRPGDLQGYGQASVQSHDQKLEWADMFALYSQPIQARDMSYWPSQPHTFRNSIEEYSAQLMKVSDSVATFIAKTLDFDLELVADKNEVQILRIGYYPPCSSAPEKVLGFKPHSDGSFLTILLEVNAVQGLQIRWNGAWIPVKPRRDALLVNVGDLLEIMTNGKYKSIEHRVTIDAHKERLSLTAFHLPNLDGIVSPVLGITDDKVLYKTTKVEEYMGLYMSSKLDGKRTLDHAKIYVI